MIFFAEPPLSHCLPGAYNTGGILASPLQLDSPKNWQIKNPLEHGGGYMRSSRIIWLIVLIPIFLGLLIPGCSDKTFTSTTTAIPQDANPTVFIPLEQGLRVSYVVLEPESQHFDIEVTDPVNIAGNPGFTIRKTDRNTDEIQLSYRYQKDNAIFESGSTSSPGERILESPFLVGNSWDRFDLTTTTNTIIDDFVDEEFEVNDGDEVDPGDSHKIKPGDDYTTMSIVGVESVESLSGNSFGNCLKVEWQTGESTYNYFWYAAGIGLVKFEQNYNSLAASSDHTIGVITDYQTVKY